ncbi:MAG: hypothetical protein QHH12_06250 [Candidatus Bathyarchaeota archaeon]|jgi:hypothetical protein|nr:hypothetical protein [Candidatus Bathyarchaeota archaeon A05DMB-3]MDH7607346.1 hypothetical protein [Candidatus Bathyarchaeota archaeon]
MSIHLHTTISKKTNDVLEELAKTYGTKSRVLEKAVETLLRVDKVGSCDDCAIKAKVNEQIKLREALDLTSIGRRNLDSLLEIAIGNKTIEDFIKEQKREAKNTIEILKSSVSWKPPSNFKEFLLVMEEIRDLTNMFDIPSYSEIDNIAIIRPKVFKRLPVIVAFQVATILEGIGVYFDMRIMGEDIAVKMVRPEIYPLRRKEFGEFLDQQIEKELANVTPGLFKNTLMLVGPAFMGWAERHLEEPITDLGNLLEDARTVLGLSEFPKEPKDFVKAVLSAFVKMNWFRQAKVLTEKDENILELVFQVAATPITRMSVAALSVMLATRGWKTLNYSTEHTTVNMTIQYVGAEDQSILDQLAELSLFQVIGKQFLDVIPVPRDLFNSFALKVYESDRRKFEEIYRATGTRISNAIRMLARNDPEKIRRLSKNFILKNISATQPDAEVRFVDDEHFTIIFKRIDPIVMNSQRVLIESMFKELGYEITTTTFQNLLSFKLKLLEKPVLEPLPRKKLMQTLIEGMSCNSVEEAFAIEKEQLDELFPEDYPWTIREVGERITDMYRELGVEVEIEYFEGGFTLKYKSCPYYKLVKTGQKTWLCSLRKKTIEYIISRVSHGKKGRIKIIKSLLQNEHPCEYAIFLTGFLEKEEKIEAQE